MRVIDLPLDAAQVAARRLEEQARAVRAATEDEGLRARQVVRRLEEPLAASVVVESQLPHSIARSSDWCSGASTGIAQREVQHTPVCRQRYGA